MFVYADNAATTALSEAAIQAMLPGLQELYGNPSSLHRKGREARRALEEARSAVARCLGNESGKVYFTSGGTEANNWAIGEAARLSAAQGKKHIISDGIEHHSVLKPLADLEKQGFEVTFLPVHENGVVRAEELKAVLRPDTGLVSVMYVNNEVGTIQPIREIGTLCRERGVLFHTDAVQAAGHLPIHMEEDCIDLLTLSGHKFHGPKGAGALCCGRQVPLGPLLRGGGQERGMRSGTEAIPAILAMAAALQENVNRLGETMAKVSAMRDQLAEGLRKLPGAYYNGDPARQAPGIVSFCFEGIEGESLLLGLDLAGICASSGSACASGSGAPSHVLTAMGIPPQLARGSLRLSLCETNTMEEVEYILQTVSAEVRKLRAACR